MTEKRFYTIHKGVYDELKRKELHHGEITSMLNALHEENEQLKKALVELKEIGDYQEGRIKELSDENEQLKAKNELLSNELEQCKAVIDNRWSEYLKKKGVEDECLKK